ncbi:MAG: hypothetical protein CMN74_10630, partial [Sphingorhabdus sp.]|nr:hypothetical protein [Sphingorhabdus sp.]
DDARRARDAQMVKGDHENLPLKGVTGRFPFTMNGSNDRSNPGYDSLCGREASPLRNFLLALI